MQSAQDKRRPLAGTLALVLKLSLSVGSLYVLYISFWIIRTSFQSEPPSGYLPPTALQSMRSATPTAPSIQTPWPSYPGAKGVRKSHNTINGSPWISERFEAAGSNSQILSFYRQHLRTGGWRDITEELFGINPRFGAGGAPRNLQNQKFLVRYDGVIRSNLAMTRGEKFILAQVSEGSKSWKRRVSLRYSGVTPQAYSMDLTRRIQPRRGKIAPFIEAENQIAGESHNSEFFRSVLSPQGLFQKLSLRMEGEGWKEAELPAGIGPTGVAGGRMVCYVRQQDYALLQVMPSPNAKGSSGLIMRADSNR